MARHASLAEQLTAFKVYAARPETVEPLQTNWQVTPHSRPASFNPEDLVDMHTERHDRIRPSLQRISAALTGVEFAERRPARWSETQKPGKPESHPIGGDIERNEHGAIIRMGKLRFSDGNATEKAFKVTIDGKVVMFDARVPIGGMLGTSETQERPTGGADDTGDASSNHFFADTLGVKLTVYKPGGKRRKGRSYTATESADMLTKAIANTPVMPDVTYCPDGLACGAQRVADQFNGMKKGRSGESGSMAWADIGSALSERDVWASSLQALKDEDRDTLKKAATAKGFGDIGTSLGFGRSWAPQAGKRALIAANDNLAREYKKRA